MTEEGFKRKLAAILSADAEGYSRLMGQNEEQTIRRLTSYRTIVSDFVLQYRGRVVDTPGDNILAEYSSVVDAIRSAVQIQTELAERNARLPMEQRMQFRIGINLGDVVEEKDRIYGDGVNIAARVESMADAGGICISGTAFDQIKHKLPFRYKYQGRKIVKNIKEPIRVYRILMEQETASEVKDVKNLILKHWRKAIFALGVTVFLIAVAAGFVWNAYFRLPSVERIPEERRAFKLPRGPSIAVLPFVNMSGDYEQEYFSDGLTENIITGLSGCPKLLVIARNSTFTYKGQPIIIQKVARELGVEYVVEGSVQKAKDRVRVTVQLIDAASGHHLWAEKYDRDLKDIFALQDEITLKIVSALEVQLTEGQQARLRLKGPVSLEAYTKGLKGLEYIRRHNKEDVKNARMNAEEAIALAPKFAGNYVLLAATHVQDIIFGTSTSPLISFAKANENLKKAFALDKDNSDAYLVLGTLYLMKGQHDKAIAAEEKAVSLNPSGADAYCQLAFILLMSDKPKESIGILKKAIRLNPNPPGYYFMVLGHSYIAIKKYEEAIHEYNKALKREPTNLFAHMGLAVAYINNGMTNEAHEVVANIYRLEPNFSLENYPNPHVNSEVVRDWFGALRKAGLN